MGRYRGAIIADQERCKGCNLCVAACPQHILSLTEKQVNRKGYHFVTQGDKEPCTGCAACAIICPDGCITVYRKKEE